MNFQNHHKCVLLEFPTSPQHAIFQKPRHTSSYCAMLAQACNPSTWIGVQGQFWMHSEFKASLNYMISPSQTLNQPINEKQLAKPQ